MHYFYGTSRIIVSDNDKDNLNLAFFESITVNLFSSFIVLQSMLVQVCVLCFENSKQNSLTFCVCEDSVVSLRNGAALWKDLLSIQKGEKVTRERKHESVSLDDFGGQVASVIGVLLLLSCLCPKILFMSVWIFQET